MEAWMAAGGDPKRLMLYQQIAQVKTFAHEGSRCLAAIHPALPTIGAIGDWHGDDRVRLQAETWLAKQGATIARGPMEVCSWFTYRVNLGPHDVRPFLLEPSDRPERWMAAGYTETAHYTSTLVPHAPVIEQGDLAAEPLQSDGWRVEALRPDQDGHLSVNAYQSLVGHIHRISLEAFADAYAYAPIPLGALMAMYEPLRLQVDPTLIFLAYDPNNEVVGFIFSFIDAGLPPRILIKSIAIHSSAQGRRLSWWLMAETHREAQRRGLPDAVHCLRRDDALTTQHSKKSQTIFRHYALLEKCLPSAQ